LYVRMYVRFGRGPQERCGTTSSVGWANHNQKRARAAKRVINPNETPELEDEFEIQLININ
jgi:hypothetical protein